VLANCSSFDVIVILLHIFVKLVNHITLVTSLFVILCLSNEHLFVCMFVCMFVCIFLFFSLAYHYITHTCWSGCIVWPQAVYSSSFYRAMLCIVRTMPSQDMSACPSVCPSVRHTPLICRNG